MNRRQLSLAALVLIALGGALFGVKWKRDNPMLTAEDKAIRQRLLTAKIAYVEYHAMFFYIVSDEDKRQIASHFFTLEDQNYQPLIFRTPPVISAETHRICWENPNVFYDAIFMDEKNKIYFYKTNRGAAKPLHPVTIRYMNRWLEQSRIQRHLAGK